MNNTDYFQSPEYRSEKIKRRNQKIRDGTIISIVSIGVILFVVLFFIPFMNKIDASMQLPDEENLADAEQNVINDMLDFNVYGQGYTDDEYDGHDCWVHKTVTNPDGSSWSGKMCVDGYSQQIKLHQDTLNHIAELKKELSN